MISFNTKYKVCLLVLLSFLIGLKVNAQIYNVTSYENSYIFLNKMLINDPLLNFKDAVISSESVYCDTCFNSEELNRNLDLLTQLVKYISNSNIITYSGADKNTIVTQASLFKLITDSTIIKIDTINSLKLQPYTYDFSDPFGEKDWTKMFVSKLLETGKGNCHSLPYLYKILADELGVPAYLAFAPNHIYIKSYSEKTGWYNTELTSGTFPIDAWIMASGYVTLEAVQNGLYMDTLSNKQAVANCLVDLAQGYQRKFGKDNPDFVIKCCNTCLKYHPVNVNAMLTKAEAQKHYILKQMEAKKLKKPQDLFSDVRIKEMYEDMEQTYVKLHQLGYRRMPEEMYLQWMNSLRNEPTKYNNPKVSVSKKKK